jgi:hypothetical protein
MAGDVIAGILELKLNGEVLNAKGNFTYNLGEDKSDPIVGADRVHGFMEKPQAPRIEGEITDDSELDAKAIVGIKNASVALTLRNGKMISLTGARYTGEGDIQTEESNIPFVLHGLRCEEIN